MFEVGPLVITRFSDFFIPYMKRSDNPSRKSCR